MWIVRRPPSRDVTPSQNIEPQPGQQIFHSPPQTTLIQQVDKLAKNIHNYQPISDLLSTSDLLSSVHNIVKKFRESVFMGQVQQGKRNGLGIMLYVNGRVYEGQWADNFKQGKGYEKFSNGSVYKGDYVRGKPQGCGRYEWQNGEVYQGQWVNGLKHGSGIWRGAKGDSYIGQWSQGRADGYGVHTWVNGDRYQGEFKDCLKHGQGVQHFANGDSYKGNYEQGKPSGYGEYYWASGSFFKGQFENGLRCGQGVWKKGAGRSDKYEGGWQADKKEGYGVFMWADGSIYRGHFSNDLKEGQGQISYIDGTSMKGIWHYDQPVEDLQNNFDQFQHEEDCELLMPAPVKAYNNPEASFFENFPQHAFYQEPQRPVLRSTAKHVRPRTFAKNTARSQIRLRGQSQGSKRQNMGMVKKMSVGTVRGKPQMTRSNQKSMSSSFFLYKLHGQEPKRGQYIPPRQTRTSGASRNRRGIVQDELKYFMRNKIGSYSEFH